MTTAPMQGPDPINPIPPGMIGDVRRSNLTARRDIDHWHEIAEFDLVIRGTATYALDDTTYLAKPGTLIWMAPGQRHKLTRSPGLQMWVVSFEPSLLDPHWLVDIAAQPSRELSGAELLSLDRLLSEVAQDSDEAAAYNAGVSYVVMRALRASHNRPAATLRAVHPAVTRALMLMRQEENSSSLSDLAKAAGIAAPYLSRLLTEQTGRSFIDWRNRIRLDRFLEGFQPGANLLNAALDAGFGSYARFHHVFAEIIGCPPSEWMTRLEEGRVVAKPGACLPVQGYGIPLGGLLSARQRWAALVSLVHPAVAPFLGKGFADRVVSASAREPGPPTMFDDIDITLTPLDIETFIAAFGTDRPDDVRDYGRLIGEHDFERIYAGVLKAYDLVPARLTDLISALMTIVWGAVRDVEVTPAEAVAGRRQVEGALAAWPSKVDQPLLREARVAMQCQFVVLYQALQAVRASGDQRLCDQLAEAARDWGIAVFGRDLSRADMTLKGVHLRPGLTANPPVRRPRARSTSA